MNNIKIRLLQYIDYENISRRKFCQKIDISPSNFASTGQNSALNSDILVKILTIYPNISPAWLILGEGDMLRSGQVSVVQGNRGNVCQGGVQSVVSGAGATLQASSQQDTERLLAIISQKDIQIAEKDIQIGRLLALLEKQK